MNFFYLRQEINEKKLDELQNELKSLNMTMDCVKEISPNVKGNFKIRILDKL